jgi:hypothetical protein
MKRISAEELVGEEWAEWYSADPDGTLAGIGQALGGVSFAK